CSYSRLICSNSSTLALQSTGPSVLGFAHDRVVGSTFTVGPIQSIEISRAILRQASRFVSSANLMPFFYTE
ncbi:MAG TPA: hypothetical protein VM182_08650, partial [Terriglobia bacterium]|nr:hypothetical protein [Terriglobia bacterium]